MENNFYTDDDFEHFLRTATDDFQMYPSRKIWHSLYNDLHPGRKWPSLAVSLVLVSAILFLGISNNNSINRNNLSALSAKILIPAEKDNTIKTEKVSTSTPSTSFSFYPARTPATTGSLNTTPLLLAKNASDVANKDFAINLPSSETAPSKTSTSLPSSVLLQGNHVENRPVFTIAGVEGRQEENKKLVLTNIENNEAMPSLATRSDNQDMVALTPTALLIAAVPSAKAGLLAEDKAWIENYAFQNRKGMSRLKSFASLQYYATTALGFRMLKQKEDANVGTGASSQSLVATNQAVRSNINDQVTQQSAMNMEIGAALIYNINKTLRLKTGLQFNYTNYISMADKLNHPTETSLLLNNGSGYTAAPRISNFVNTVNGQKNQKLNNTTIQISMPVGADIKLTGNGRVKWYAGATLQPTFVSGGNVFAISADSKNYIEESSLLRKWNMNTSIETFISYKTSSGIIINAGPQLRYQLLSTYNTRYSFSEKLYNIGLKLGFTKNF